MANEEKSGLNRGLKKLANSIQSNIDKLYSSTYFSHPTNNNDLEGLKKEITTSINTITNNNFDNVGMSSVSTLYTRLQSNLKDPALNQSIKDIFLDQSKTDNLMQAYMENKYLKDLDNEIDTVCKYMPKLLEALDTRKDNVLSADHFSKDFVSVPNNTTIDNTTFAERINVIKKKYDFLSQAEIWYNAAAKYGEQFLYVVPYSQALKRLKSSSNGLTSIKESVSYYDPNAPVVTNTLNTDKKINLIFNQSSIIDSIISEREKAARLLDRASEKSVCIEYSNILENKLLESNGNDTNDLTKRKRVLNTDDGIKSSDLVSIDGLITNKKMTKSDDTDTINVPGCIIKRLDRWLVKPIYIEDLFMGCYYIELEQGAEFDFNSNDSMFNSTLAKKNMSNMMADEDNNIMLKNMASQISSTIDSKFINNNIDLTKEIYMILKYNDLVNKPNTSMKITYIPPEDIIHIKFNEDENHRGVSDLTRALFPAKLYSYLYITNVIANLTRSFDKRVYYVKQTIDNNIAKTLLSTINQIKRSNFNIRQIQDINNILNLTGVFNDFLIPTNGNNESPINFEIMQGQQVNMPTEIMDTLEEMAINSTDVPLELIQARQSMDYAVQYTMSNTKFLRKVYNRQGQYQRFLSTVISKIYNYEYNDNADLEVVLPPPVFLNITNTSQIIQNTNEFANSIGEMRMAAETNDMVKAIFIKKVKEHYLGSYIDTSILEKLENEAKQEASLIDEE